ncbi:MAG TPA: glycosyltransferase family 9 protein [Candidatus Eisenbacteria bacterium]|nr:glycosyltransferase family 9 protein [Candidatus Eisenbacteria bacterium]
MPSPDRILVVRHRAAGDLLLTTPAFRALREGIPGARIEVLAAKGMAPLLEGNPDVDRVLTFDRRSLASQALLYARLARGGYSMALDLVSNPRSAFLTALTRARIRAGYDIPGRAWAYTVRVPREPIGADGRPALRYAPEAALDVVRALGVPARGLDLRFTVSAAARAAIAGWLDGAASAIAGRPIVLCLPTGSWPAKTWLPERFAAVMDELAPEATPVWIWGPGERDAVDAARASMTRPSLLAPPTGWQELGALIERAALLVGNDSGPKHLAVALGTPTVTIFGPTHPATWHPPTGPHAAVEATGLDCLHCNANRCPLEGERHLRCMRDVTPARVAAAARALLNDHANRPGGERSCASR